MILMEEQLSGWRLQVALSLGLDSFWQFLFTHTHWLEERTVQQEWRETVRENLRSRSARCL